jgi:hypothetical protein
MQQIVLAQSDSGLVLLKNPTMVSVFRALSCVLELILDNFEKALAL